MISVCVREYLLVCLFMIYLLSWIQREEMTNGQILTLEEKAYFIYNHKKLIIKVYIIPINEKWNLCVHVSSFLHLFPWP